MSDDFSLTPLNDAELPEFKREMQRAFQLGYEAEFGPCDKPILPEGELIGPALSGPEALKMKMTGKPGFVGDEYFISASGADVRAKLDIYSESSAIAGWSLVALLRNLASPIELH